VELPPRHSSMHRHFIKCIADRFSPCPNKQCPLTICQIALTLGSIFSDLPNNHLGRGGCRIKVFTQVISTAVLQARVLAFAAFSPGLLFVSKVETYPSFFLRVGTFKHKTWVKVDGNDTALSYNTAVFLTAMKKSIAQAH
jgi:hypothetical protein